MRRSCQDRLRAASKEPTNNHGANARDVVPRERLAPRGPAYETDPLAHVDLLDDILGAFVKSARDSHGIDGKSFRRLAIPVGLRESQISSGLLDRLDALANIRNPASHTYVNRARSLAPPEDEVRSLNELLAEFDLFDAALDVVSASFPTPSP